MSTPSPIATSPFVLVRTKDLSYYADTDIHGSDVSFPDEIRGWSDVLDCRIPPYTKKSLDENCSYARGVRKYFILVSRDYLEQQ